MSTVLPLYIKDEDEMSSHDRKERFYITTPIYYVNDLPHIGHAYTSLACDVMARYYRIRGIDSRLLTGTDEHGLKIQRSAESRGETPQALTDRISDNFRLLAGEMNVSYDDFIRTTEERHKEECQKLWCRLYDRGDIYKGKYAGWYATSDEAYVEESELIEKDGKYVVASGAEVEWVEEESYFFRLSRFQDRLLDYYKSHPDFVYPKSRYNEVVSFVEGGLEDLSVSRTTFSWGVPVPGDESHVMYVWLDALVNYVSALGRVDPPSALHEKYWPADWHVVGKDILRFHAVYWPAFLMSADLPLPRGVFAHGWWTSEGQKISKRLGNVLDPVKLKRMYGLDQLRYFLLREVPFGRDGDFVRRRLCERNNADLANDYGNLCQRTLVLLSRYGEGIMPQLEGLLARDEAFLLKVKEALKCSDVAMERLGFDEALSEIWKCLRMANIYIDNEEPWRVVKEDRVRGVLILGVILEVLRRVSLYVWPFMPDSCDKILDLLGVGLEDRRMENLEKPVAGGTQLPPPEIVFPRLREEEIEDGT